VRRDEQVQIWHGDKLRFTGRVTTIKAVQTGGRTITELACLGNLARVAQVNLVPVEMQEGTERQRVESILARVPSLAPVDPILAEWGTQHSPFRFRREFVENTDPVPAIDLLHTAAANTGAILWERPNGKIVYEALVAREGKQRSATVSAWQIDDGVGWEKTAAQPPRTVQVWYGPKPGDPVKPPERPGSLTGIDLDTIQVGGWWVGAPAANGPPWLPAGREIWLSSAADPVTGIAWQLATTQAVAGADSQVWLRQRVGGSWTAWRWQSGGLPDAVSVDFDLPTGVAMSGVKFHSQFTARLSSPVPVWARIELHIKDVTVAVTPTVVHHVRVGVAWGLTEAQVTFNAGQTYASGHTSFVAPLGAGTSSLTLWTSASGGATFTTSAQPQGVIKVAPIAIQVGDLRTLNDIFVPIPDPPEPTPIGGVPPIEPPPEPAPAPASPVVI
jgi:hypothetical protein